MKLFRRKKNGREVGTIYVRPKGGGRPISLALNGVPCVDFKEAARRAKLALKGKWPPAASGAAKAAARAEHVPEDDDVLGPGPRGPKGGGVASGPSPVPSPSAAAEPDPSPETPPAAADPGDEPDPVAAASAAAADAAGPADAPSPVGDDEAARRERWGQDFAARFGSSLSAEQGGLSPGMVCALAELKAAAGILNRRAAKLTPPSQISVSADAIAAPMQMLAMAWDEQLRRWGIDLALAQPWMVIAGATVGLLIAVTTAPLVPLAKDAAGAPS